MLEPRGHWEGLSSPRSKTGLETPLEGRMVGEKALVFAPPRWYEGLMAACVGGGLVIIAGSFLGIDWPRGLTLLNQHWLGWAVLAAGIWAFLSTERMVCSLRSRTWIRQEGGILRTRITRGSFDQLDALVVRAENKDLTQGVMGSHLAAFRIVLHWKGQSQPPLVLDRLDTDVPTGYPLSQGAAPLFGKATVYGRVLGLPIYDNTQQFSGAPQRPF